MVPAWHTRTRGSSSASRPRSSPFLFLPHRLINKLPPSLKFPVTEEMMEQVTFPEIDKAYMLALTMRRKRLASGNEEQA